MGGTKHDKGKAPWHLMSGPALEQVAEVLNFGASKYDDRNWEKGINFSRLFSATQRHLWAWWGRETWDQETDLNHLAHAMCNIMFILHHQLNTQAGLDDRPTGHTMAAGRGITTAEGGEGVEDDGGQAVVPGEFTDNAIDKAVSWVCKHGRKE